MDKVYIAGLKVDTIIGVYEWEQNTVQMVVLDIELFCDTTEAAKTDDVNYALDYAEIASEVTSFISNNRFKLLETLAAKTADLIQARFSVQHLKLQVAKPSAVANADSVGVSIERG